ncbi:hypothetical protein G6F57_017816 [Rhizopus arrhizus]|nr:hypothetical protein G6F57_017816 [Rhizopus arrhizus]
MNTEEALLPGAVFDWVDHFMTLGQGGGMRQVGKLRRLSPQDGWLVGIKAVASDADVHGDVWERHPAGDEMLCVLEGRVVLTLMEDDGGQTDVPLDHRQGTVVPRGVALVIGCSTFPTWNGYPGLFASLATGNTVIVKPHPGAILPLAITVKVAREVLQEAGFDPDVVLLAAHEAGDDTAQKLALDPAVKIVDFTGSTANGDWLENNARQALVYTEKAGVNQVIIDSTADLKGVARNLAFSLALYSGQMPRQLR